MGRLTLILIIFSAFSLSAQPTLSFVTIETNFERPVDITHAGDGSDRLFVVDQTGYIRIIDSSGVLLTTPFLDIDHKTFGSGERGLLGLAFHPEYSENGYFFINYTDDNNDTRIARYTVSDEDPNVADTLSHVTLFDIAQPYSNHNGGCLKFGPDGYLYIAMGDGGSSGDPGCRAQDPQSLLGKILRVDIDSNVNTAPYYGVPSDNPFVLDTNFLDEIWSYGLRNPWKISFDRSNGNLWIADVGQDQQEEVNLQLASSAGGENYGWKVMEGDYCYEDDPESGACDPATPGCGSTAYSDPLFYYTQFEAQGGNSITGGYVYRGCRYPALTGYYIAADFIKDHVWLVDSTGADIFYDNMPRGITSFGENENGELYATAINPSRLYEIRETTVPFDVTIAEADSPISGTISAVNSITVKGNVTVSPTDTVYLIAPKIFVGENFNINNTSIVKVIKKCD